MILAVSVITSGAIIGGGAGPPRLDPAWPAAIVAYAIPFEVYAWAVAVLWVGLGGLALRDGAPWTEADGSPSSSPTPGWSARRRS